MSKSIEINYLGDSGYEVLYPNTMLNSVLDWQENLYSKNEILDSATKTLYGLGTDAVPDDVLEILSNAALVGETSLTDVDGNAVGVQIATGSYVGTGQYGASNPNVINTEFPPHFLLLYQRLLSWTKSDSPPIMYAVDSETSVIDVTRYTNSSASSGTIPLRITWGETSVSWYLDGTSYYGKQQQFNTGTWYYLVLG